MQCGARRKRVRMTKMHQKQQQQQWNDLCDCHCCCVIARIYFVCGWKEEPCTDFPSLEKCFVCVRVRVYVLSFVILFCQLSSFNSFVHCDVLHSSVVFTAKKMMHSLVARFLCPYSPLSLPLSLSLPLFFSCSRYRPHNKCCLFVLHFGWALQFYEIEVRTSLARSLVRSLTPSFKCMFSIQVDTLYQCFLVQLFPY